MSVSTFTTARNDEPLSAQNVTSWIPTGTILFVTVREVSDPEIFRGQHTHLYPLIAKHGLLNRPSVRARVLDHRKYDDMGIIATRLIDDAGADIDTESLTIYYPRDIITVGSRVYTSRNTGIKG